MTDKEYYELIQPYEDAMKLLLTRLEVLNHSIYETKTGKPIHNIQYRIKKKDSIEEGSVAGYCGGAYYLLFCWGCE